MSILPKISGSWRNTDYSSVNINGNWRQVIKAYVNIGGSWRECYKKPYWRQATAMPSNKIGNITVGNASAAMTSIGRTQDNYDSNGDPLGAASLSTYTWNGSSWSTQGNHIYDRRGAAYFGTYMSAITDGGSKPISGYTGYIYRETCTFNGTSWSHIANDPYYTEYCLCGGISNSLGMTAGGMRTTGGSSSESAVVEYFNGTSWSSLSSLPHWAISFDFSSLKLLAGSFPNDVIALGYNALSTGYHVIKYNGSVWSVLMNYDVNYGTYTEVAATYGYLAAGVSSSEVYIWGDWPYGRLVNRSGAKFNGTTLSMSGYPSAAETTMMYGSAYGQALENGMICTGGYASNGVGMSRTLIFS